MKFSARKLSSSNNCVVTGNQTSTWWELALTSLECLLAFFVEWRVPVGAYLFGSVLWVTRQIIVGVVSLSDPAEQHGNHALFWVHSEQNVTVDCNLKMIQLMYNDMNVVPVKPQASANRKVLQDMRKNSAVSSKGKSLSLVNLVTLMES